MTAHPTFRLAGPAERSALEDLQRRASLIWEEDRDALLANPDAIELPLEQITGGRTIVAENVGGIEIQSRGAGSSFVCFQAVAFGAGYVTVESFG